MTWLYTPLNCLPGSASLERDCEPGSDTWASRLAPSVTLNGKLTRPQSWRLACKRAAWMRHLCGATLPHSTLDAGVAQWIASLVASRVKTSALQADALGLTESGAAYFLKFAALPMIAVRGSSFWRTSQASLLPPPPLWTRPKANSTNAQPPASWENWPTVGGMRSGALFQRPAWAPAMGGNGGFAGRGEWRTPISTEHQNDRKSNEAMSREAGRTGAQVTVAMQARQWATPQARDHRSPDQPESGNFQRKLEQGYTIDLNSQASAWNKWPTPNAHVIEHKSKPPIVDGTRKPSDPQISTADIAVHQFLHQAQPTAPGQESSSNTPTSPRRLNPAFTEWLMGWPTGWTIAAPSASSAAATELWRCKLQQQLCNLFNGPTE